MKKKILMGLITLSVAVGSFSGNVMDTYGSEIIESQEEIENNDIEINEDVDSDSEDIDSGLDDSEEEKVKIEESDVLTEDDEQNIVEDDDIEFSDDTTEVGETSAEDNIQVVDSGKCGPRLYYQLTSDKDAHMTLTFSGTGNMYAKKFGWRNYCDKINKIVFVEGMTNIIDGAFYNCSNLEGKLELPNSLKKIGESAFRNCIKITGELKLPSELTEIGYCAFGGCIGLTGQLKLPNRITKIEPEIFSGCTGLTGQLKLPKGITEIGASAFCNCAGFTGELRIPSSVTKIGASAFRGCAGFTGDLVLPENLEYVDDYIFDGCSGFNGNLKFPKELAFINTGAFRNCVGLKGKVEIPRNLVRISAYAFENCYNITEIVSADQLWILEGEAFKDCINLKSIYIGVKLEYINGDVFDNCPNVTIYSYENGAAQKYAEEYGIPFKKLEKKNINQLTMIPAKIGTQFYTESAYNYPQVTLYDDDKKLVEQFDYFLRFENNRSAGKVKVVIDGTGLYCGEKIIEFNIMEKRFDVNMKKIPLKVKQSVTLKTPLKWVSINNCKSGNKKIATVTKNGKVKGIRAGKTYITVTLSNGCTGKIPVTVQKGNVRASRLTLNAKKINLKRKRSFTLKPSLFPITAREKITYKSSNTKIATVNKNGRIVAKKAGTVTIRVTAGKAKARCKVTVKK